MDDKENNQELDPATENENTDTEAVSSESEPTDWQAEALKWKGIATRKAKQLEAKKEQPSESKAELPKQEPTLSRDEAVLIARGYSDEAIAKLKAIAFVGNFSLTQAEKDDMFIAWKEKKDAEEKAEKAKLNASKGSGHATSKKGYQYGMSADDHKEIWKEKMGK